MPFSYVHSTPASAKQRSYAAALSITLSPALLIIDHIHFQYNGFLYGALVLSLVAARKGSTLLSSGLLFALLLCLKHIYLYLAPSYFVYLLRVYCLSSKSILRIRFGNTVVLASGLLVVIGVAIGPFIYWQQVDQLLARLFPFARGLCHAYWAPNIWSMYSFIDRVLLLGTLCNSFLLAVLCSLTPAVAPRFGITVNATALNSVTRGLVGDSSFACLPNISPRTTFVLTLASQTVRISSSWDGSG